VKRAVQRFGRAATARRPPLAERKRLRAELTALHVERRRLERTFKVKMKHFERLPYRLDGETTQTAIR
jgi:hypothetical protein